MELDSSKLDYSTSVFHNRPGKDIAKLQRVQSCLVTVVTNAPRFSLSVPILKRLHWLPVKFRIHFEICAITFQILKKNPAYLADLLVRPKCSKYLRFTNSNRLIEQTMGQEFSLYLAQPYGTPFLCPYVMSKQF